jgi:hypothetical protein
MRALLIGLIAAATLAQASCGGDDGLSRDELVSEADAVCARYEQELDELAEPRNVEDVERLAEEAKPIIEDGLDELRELEPPEELADEYDEWISQNEESVDVLDELREAASEGDVQRIQDVLQEAQQAEREADELARELGLQDCARN